MRIERMTELIMSGKAGMEMVKARQKRWWQMLEVWEKMIAVAYLLWKPYVERWGHLGLLDGEGKGFQGGEDKGFICVP